MAKRVGFTTSGRALFTPALYDSLVCSKCKRAIWRSIRRDPPHIMDLFTRTGNQRPICRICRPVLAEARETEKIYQDPADWSAEDLIRVPARFWIDGPPNAAPDAALDAAVARSAGIPTAPPAPPAGPPPIPVPANLRPFSAFAGSPFAYAPDGAILAVAWDEVVPPPFAYRVRWSVPATEGYSDGRMTIGARYQTAYIPHIPAPCTVRVTVAAIMGFHEGAQSPSLVLNVPARDLPEEIAAFHLTIAGAPPEEAEEDARAAAEAPDGSV